MNRRRMNGLSTNGTRLIGLLVVVGLSLGSLPAQASPWALRVSSPEASEPAAAPAESGQVDPEAIAAFDKGSNAYALGNYEEAVGHFERAFELSHRSELLFNIGQAYSRWYDLSQDPGHLRKARKLLENYLEFLAQRDGPDDAGAALQAEERLAEIDEQLATLDAAETPADSTSDKPLRKRGWFWAVVVGGAALVAGGVTTAIVLSRRNGESEFEPELGSVGRGRAPGGLAIRF